MVQPIASTILMNGMEWNMECPFYFKNSSQIVPSSYSSQIPAVP